MENEYRERKPDLNPNAGSNDRSGKKKESNVGREALESLQGNVYRERAEEPKTAMRYTTEETTASAETTNKTRKQRKETNGKAGKDGAKAKKAPKRANIIVQVLNGDILTRDFVTNNLTFIFFFLFLLLLVVSKGYYGKQLNKDIETLQTEVNANTSEYIENKARLEELTTRYRLVEMLERRGLKESLKPAKVIRIKQPKK